MFKLLFQSRIIPEKYIDHNKMKTNGFLGFLFIMYNTNILLRVL